MYTHIIRNIDYDLISHDTIQIVDEDIAVNYMTVCYSLQDSKFIKVPFHLFGELYSLNYSIAN